MAESSKRLSIGNILLTGFVATISGLIVWGISSWASDRSPNLLATVQAHPVSLPPEAIAQLSKLETDAWSRRFSTFSISAEDEINSLQNIYKKHENLLKDSVEGVEVNIALKDAERALRLLMDDYADLVSQIHNNDKILNYDLFNSKSVWNIEIVNKGNRSASNVRVVVPDIVYASVERDGISLAIDNLDKVLEIGEIQAEETVVIVAWSKKNINYYSETPIIRQSDGLVKQIKYGYYPSNIYGGYQVWQAIKWVVIWIVSMIGLIMLVGFISAYIQSKLSTQNRIAAESESDVIK